jgi:cytochrome c biogenesis protein CcmG/thiol:disulfide interchange protein DsbE
MKKFVIPSAILAAAVALIVLLAYGVSTHADTGSLDARVARGDFPVAPDYRSALPVLGSSATADLASFDHKIVVVNVYASWCTACQQESPLLAREQSVLSRHGATFVGITYEDAASSTEAFDRRNHLDYPVLRDVNGELVQSFGTYRVPETFVISRTGHILAIRREPLNEQWFAQTLMPILKKQTA